MSGKGDQREKPTGGSQIVCRTCREPTSLHEDNCPHCGTSIRDPKTFVALAGLGSLLFGGSLFELGTLWLFAFVGVGLVATGLYFLKDRRDRIRAAASGGSGERTSLSR